ncbi:MAG: preprotein translocase subunit YajC [candidate division WOR-3 bacterium]
MELLFGQTQGQTQSNPLFNLLPLILIFVIFYFLLVLPQQKRQKQHQQLLNSLKKGDRVITSSGIYGTVANIKDNIISLVIADGVKVDMDKNHIVSKIGMLEEEK